jgi:hypothetical protein
MPLRSPDRRAAVRPGRAIARDLPVEIVGGQHPHGRLQTAACVGLFRRHDAGEGVVCESKDRDRWLADGEGRCGDDRPDQAFEAFSGLRQFGRKTRRSGMHLGADMMGDETHDALAVFRRQSLPGVAEALGQAIDPQATVRIEHDLDDGLIFQPARDRRPHCRTQHANAA